MESQEKDTKYMNILYDKDDVVIQWGGEDYVISGWGISGWQWRKRSS